MPELKLLKLGRISIDDTLSAVIVTRSVTHRLTRRVTETRRVSD